MDQITLGVKPFPQVRPALLIARKSIPVVRHADAVQASTRAFTQSGTGTVRICPPLPFRSAMIQCPSRSWISSIFSAAASARRRPQPISKATMARFLSCRRIGRPERANEAIALFCGQPIANTNAEAARSSHPSDPCSKIRAQQPAIGCLVGEAADRCQSETDSSGGVRFLLKSDSVAGHHRLVEGQPRLRTIPVDELPDCVIICTLGARRCQAVQHGSFRLFQIWQLQNGFRRPFALRGT